MKRLFTLATLVVAMVLSSCEFDDSEIWDKLKDHEKRITALEELCKQMNTNITSLQTIVNALEKHDYITNISPIRKDGEDIGYTITFAYSNPITIYHGQDGADGKDGQDGYTPKIGVKKDSDGIYYWTLDGEWLLDSNGNKIKAVGVDGKDGQDGTDGKDGQDGQDGSNGTNGADGKDGADGENGRDGQDGKDGADGITPRLKIENDYWYVSYDEGATWIKLGKATGEDGADGSDGMDGVDGADGDNIFSSVTQDDEYVYFNLADGTMITLPKHDKENIQFEDLNVKAICCKNWDTNNDGELSYTEAAAVKTIGTAFQGNTNIIAFTELKYFTGLTKIPRGAFKDCSALWKITIPEGVTSLEDGISGTPASGCFGNCTSLTNISLPAKLIRIGLGAFYNCNSLQNITIPDAATYIGKDAFRNCTALLGVTIPDNVAIIGDGAFAGCTGLKYMHIGEGVSEFGYDPFSNCTGELICNSSVRDLTSSSGSGVFSDSAFTKATFGGRCTKIGSSAFESVETITTVILEKSVVILSSNAFNYGNVYNTGFIDYVYCKSPTPPQGNSTMFDSSVQKIYVPIGCGATYKAASGWKTFSSKIEEFDFDNNTI
ncbi:MAG: leucine-rich repeat protein [Rikenellaceae bacterium]|nr:leucine-rich repeat protein [Rikenellaceae bacterium]